MLTFKRAAQIRAGLWRRNGPGMNDQVLNYAEPPFCRPLADADMLLLQFSLICHTSRVAGSVSTMDEDGSDVKKSIVRLAFVGQGTARLVVIALFCSFLIHCKFPHPLYLSRHHRICFFIGMVYSTFLDSKKHPLQMYTAIKVK